ncbi:MAG TPA: preprotein translocase subunit SecE [Gaiellaceae bacterium]
MARTDRQQRRQRRAEKAGTPPLRPAPRKPAPEKPVEAAAVEAAPTPDRQAEEKRGIWGVRFMREAWAELKKVEWPTQQKVISGTAVVIVACLLVGTFLYVNDRVWGYVVQHVLLR